MNPAPPAIRTRSGTPAGYAGRGLSRREVGDEEREAEIRGKAERSELAATEPGGALAERPEDGERVQALAAEAVHQARAEQGEDDGPGEQRPRPVPRSH